MGKRVLFCFVGCFLALSGCVMPNMGLTTISDADTNVYNLTQVSCGMTECEVLCIMRQPYCDQTFEMDGDTYDVWFYVTEPTVLGQSRMVPLNLTPLTFKNGHLIGWGYAYYNYLKKRQMNLQKPSELPREEPAAPVEDIELEKALKRTEPQTMPTPQIQQKVEPPSTPSPKDRSKQGAEPSGNWGPLERQDEKPTPLPQSPQKAAPLPGSSPPPKPQDGNPP